MNESVQFIVFLFLFVCFISLGVTVKSILTELRKQGDQRAADAKRIADLLKSLTRE